MYLFFRQTRTKSKAACSVTLIRCCQATNEVKIPRAATTARRTQLISVSYCVVLALILVGTKKYT